MSIKTRLCSILNIDIPIIQGGMAWVATGELAAAVSNAGGLGIIGAGNAPADIIKRDIDKAKKNTDKPFGVNIMLLSPYLDDIVELVVNENVPVVTTGAGNPGKYVNRFQEKGIKVIPVVASVSLAKRMERLGVDALIAEGTEAGGHIGELTTMALIPQIVDAVSIPVVAAGGIADGRGMVAALSLGALGVQIGTRFVCSTECIVHENYKNAIIKAKDRDAIITGRITGHPVRNLKNNLTREISNLEKNGASIEEIEDFGAGKLALAANTGEIENGSVMAGQISGLINDIKPVAEIINGIIKESEIVINLLSSDFLEGN
jgi:enoyl-[acyl-carrier protein] reductase II